MEHSVDTFDLTRVSVFAFRNQSGCLFPIPMVQTPLVFRVFLPLYTSVSLFFVRIPTHHFLRASILNQKQSACRGNRSDLTFVVMDCLVSLTLPRSRSSPILSSYLIFLRGPLWPGSIRIDLVLNEALTEPVDRESAPSRRL